MNHTPHVFWAYFLANEERLYDLACADPHAAVDELDQALRKAGVPLGAEIGTKPGEPHDLVFTSNGDTSLFVAVYALVSDAPSCDRWIFTALRQPRGFDFRTDYEGVSLDPREIWFLPLIRKSDPPQLGIRIGIKNFVEAERDLYTDACYIVVETGLGERTMSDFVSRLEVCQQPENPASCGYIPLVDLASYLTSAKRRGVF